MRLLALIMIGIRWMAPISMTLPCGARKEVKREETRQIACKFRPSLWGWKFVPGIMKIVED